MAKKLKETFRGKDNTLKDLVDAFKGQVRWSTQQRPIAKAKTWLLISLFMNKENKKHVFKAQLKDFKD